MNSWSKNEKTGKSLKQFLFRIVLGMFSVVIGCVSANIGYCFYLHKQIHYVATHTSINRADDSQNKDFFDLFERESSTLPALVFQRHLYFEIPEASPYSVLSVLNPDSVGQVDTGCFMKNVKFPEKVYLYQNDPEHFFLALDFYSGKISQLGALFYRSDFIFPPLEEEYITSVRFVNEYNQILLDLTKESEIAIWLNYFHLGQIDSQTKKLLFREKQNSFSEVFVFAIFGNYNLKYILSNVYNLDL